MESTVALWVVLVLVLLALALDFVNGFKDAPNAIATVVSSGVLKPDQAVLFSAFFNFMAYFVFPLGVAATIATGIVEPSIVDVRVVFGALLGAIIWSVVSVYLAIPGSGGHALIGSILGAAITKAGPTALIASGLWKTVVFVFLAPVLGVVAGALLMVAVAWACRRASPSKVDAWFRRLQLASAAIYSVGRGANDAQKTVGILWLLLIAVSATQVEGLPQWMKTNANLPPGWVVIVGYLTIGSATMFGGWYIVKTMGQKITKLKPVGGCCAETSGALTLAFANSLGIPISTTHTITGAMAGAGSVQRMSAVLWGGARNVVWAWILAMPVAALAAALAYGLSRFFF